MSNSLFGLGFVYDRSGGFQLDLNAVLRKIPNGFSEAKTCDHNCTIQFGNYDCPAAFTHNQNVLPDSMMRLEDITKMLKVARDCLILTNQNFLKNFFPNYVSIFRIPYEQSLFIEKALREASNNVELNLFGGNPELHPNFLSVVKIAKQLGWKVTTTTTGKKFMFDPEFTNQFLASPPHLLAISADDYGGIADLSNLLKMSLKELKNTWVNTNPLHGQRKKALESIYATKFFQNKDHFCPILFNIVVHPGNLPFIDQLLVTLQKAFPKVIMNPYPAQASFSFGLVGWKGKDLLLLEKFIDQMIKKQLEQVRDKKKFFQPRLSYWLALKSVYLTAKTTEDLLKGISGYGTWQCFARSGSGRYLQASTAVKSAAEKFKPGGHAGCFWNNTTVTDSDHHLWELSPSDVSAHILEGKVRSAKHAPKPCPGCLMPRLMFDGITTELGLNENLLPAYFNLRKKYLKF